MSELEGVSWTERLEEYFASSAEKAHCLSVLHKQAEALYSGRKTFIELPVIVGSAVIGFLNAGSTTMFQDPKIASIALGVGSLVVSVLQTINTYFSWAKRAEGHRIASIQYSRLYRFLSIEMSLPRSERLPPSELLKQTKDTYDRLQEISPLLPVRVLREFRAKYDKETEISKPEEANGLERVLVYQENPMRLRRQESLGLPTSPLPEGSSFPLPPSSDALPSAGAPDTAPPKGV
jgi:hypothetical protein